MGWIESQGANLRSNVLNGTVWRLDVTVNEYGVTINDEVEVGSGYLFTLTFPTAVGGPAGLAYDSKHDILYVASEVDNEIFAIDDASTLTANQSTPGTVVYSDTTHLHGPTGLLLLNNGDLLTANDDGTNVNPALPSELVEFTPSTLGGTFVTQLSIDPANGGAFGIALVRKGAGLETQLAYVDDNQVTLSILSLFTGFSYGPMM
jgi:DNA-binding beta-propeller fold protein YncE